jgi:hypothetical protein
MAGAILIYSCQKYKHSRIQDLNYLKPEYAGWRVFFIVGDPTISSEYTLDGNIITLRCEDSYLHLLKKTILGFKIAIGLVTSLTGVLKCGDDIVFNETELIRFLRSETKRDYMGIQGSPFVPLTSSHRDTWIVDYYKKHPEDFENLLHGLPSMDTVKKFIHVPTIQAASGPLTYFSRKSVDLLISHMERIEWNVLQEVSPYGYPYIIEEPGISFILYPFGIRVTPYKTFTESREEFQKGRCIGFHTNSYKWESPKRVCIIGAGWYGCHAARFLRSRGCYVHILDKQGIFSGASSKNQNRLHLGYHYPRSVETIKECIKGHTKFLDTYGDCVVPFHRNYYFIHKDSKVSVDTFRNTFQEGSHEETTSAFQTNNLTETMFRVDEKFINNSLAKQRMELELGSCLEICESPQIRNTTVNEIEYDYVLNCTNNRFVPLPLPYSPIYETVCTLLYKIEFDSPTGLTIMDGPFFSIFPYDIEKKLYTVTHVVYSVVCKGSIQIEPIVDLETIRHKIESDIFNTFPDLRTICQYVGYFTSDKTKYDFVKDDRSLRWFSEGRYYSFSGGKITGIFEMEPILEKLLQ